VEFFEKKKSSYDAKYSDLKKLRIRVARFPSLEEALYKRFQSLRSRNVPVFQDILAKENFLILKHQIDGWRSFKNDIILVASA